MDDEKDHTDGGSAPTIQTGRETGEQFFISAGGYRFSVEDMDEDEFTALEKGLDFDTSDQERDEE